MAQNASSGQQVSNPWRLPFPRTRWALVGFVIGVLTWSIAGGVPRGHRAAETEGPAEATGKLADATAAQAEEPAEEAGGAVGRAVRQVRDGVQDASSTVREKFADVQDSARRHSLGSSVQDRLLQNRSIDASRIEVEGQDGGTVILTGMVADDEAKETAVTVARETRGVVRVEDHLAVPPARRVFNAPATEEISASRTRRLR